jgi:lipopolysaccharide export system permease protein
VAQEAPSIKSRSTAGLLSDSSPEARAELIWRLGLPLSALVLCLLAIPLSFVNPRAGRSLNLIVAALLYMVYSNLLSIVQAWVAQEKVPPSIGLWVMHAVMLGLAIVMLRWRQSVRSPLRLRR